MYEELRDDTAAQLKARLSMTSCSSGTNDERSDHVLRWRWRSSNLECQHWQPMCFWIRFRCPYLARYRLGVWSFWCLEHDSVAGLFCTRSAVDSVWCQMVESYSNRSWREDQAACKAANVCAKSLSRGSVCDGSTVQDSCMIAPRPTRVADSELSITPSSPRVYRQVDSGDVKRLYVGWQQFLCLGFVRIQLQAVLHVPLSDVSAYTQRELTVQRLCCRSASQDEAECRQSSPYYETSYCTLWSETVKLLFHWGRHGVDTECNGIKS